MKKSDIDKNVIDRGGINYFIGNSQDYSKKKKAKKYKKNPDTTAEKLMMGKISQIRLFPGNISGTVRVWV